MEKINIESLSGHFRHEPKNEEFYLLLLPLLTFFFKE